MNETSLFAEALEIKSELERAAFLKRACGDDEQLQQRIEALLRAHGQSDAILDATADLAKTSNFLPITEKAGSQIGPYRLMEQIGEGGFGVVFVAEQQTPVRRKVALKLIKPGMDSRQVVARFEAERQALAMMDHPNIARVLDAGATETGRPYFVMELVRGISITEYCDKNHLNPRERMEIFVDVCNAIQHAHQKGIIHRDIKPSNVLVTSHDGKPVAKVIDFGVAKAIYQQLTEQTIYTQFAQMIGTPLYMSPEQAEMSGLDIDTRTDIYALGVLLYELFTGSTPLEHSRLVSAAYDEVRRMIREDEPPLPSQRISTSATLPSLAANRNTEPARLSHEMKGELDWIVMKALEKDRTRRYETASAFAADIGRYLRDEQVDACPPSAKYRLGKFLRRNRVAVLSGSLVSAALLVGIIASGALAFVASQQAEQARVALLREADQRQVADAARLAADRERTNAERERDAAQKERDKTAALNEQLILQKEQERRASYVAQLTLISKAWEDGNLRRAKDLLNETRPGPGETDLRGLEWYYWQRMVPAEERRLSIPVDLNSERFQPDVGPISSGSISNGTSFAARFSHDGQQVAVMTRSTNWKIGVWDSIVGQLLFSIELPLDRLPPKDNSDDEVPIYKGEICYVDSSRIAVATSASTSSASGLALSDTPESIAWDLKHYQYDTGEETYSKNFQGSFFSAHPFVFSRDGSRLAYSLIEPVVQVCDGHRGAEVAQVPLPPTIETRRLNEILALNSDGTQLAMKPSVSRIRAADGTFSSAAPHGITIAEIEGDKRMTTAGITAQRIEFSPDGKHLAAFEVGSVTVGSMTEGTAMSISNASKATVFDTATCEEISSHTISNTARPFSGSLGQTSAYPGWLGFSPDGKWLASITDASTGSPSLRLWDPTNGSPGLQLEWNGEGPIVPAFGAQGNRILSLDKSGTIRVWQLSPDAKSVLTPATAPRLDDHDDALDRHFAKGSSPDGKWHWNAPSDTAPVDGPSSDTANSSFVLTLEDATDQLASKELVLSGPIYLRPIFSSDGRFVAAIARDPAGDFEKDMELRVWDLSSNALRMSIKVPTIEAQMDASRRERLSSTLASPSAPFPNSPISQIRGRPVVSPAFNTEGQLLLLLPSVFGSIPNPVQAYDLTTGKLRWQFDLPPLMNAPTLSANGKRLFCMPRSLALGERVLEIGVWDALTGASITTLNLPRGRSNNSLGGPNCTPSHDGSQVALARDDGVVVCDVSTGRVLFWLWGNRGSIRRVEYSSDGKRILTGPTVNQFASSSAAIFGPSTSSTRLARIPQLAPENEIRIFDASSGQELLTVDEKSPLYEQVKVYGAGRLPAVMPEVEARWLVEWLELADRNDGTILTRSQIAQRLRTDPTISEEVRVIAIGYASEVRRDVNLLNGLVWSMLAAPSEQPKMYQRAEELINEAAEQYPQDTELLKLRALLHYRLGQYSETLAALDESIKSRVADYGNSTSSKQQVDELHFRAQPDELALQAMAFYHLGQADKARQSFHRARYYTQPRLGMIDTSGMRSGPSSTRLKIIDEARDLLGVRTYWEHMARGVTLTKQREFDKALAAFNAAIGLDPLNPFGFSERAALWQQQGQVEKALQDYGTALRLPPEDPMIYSARAWILATTPLAQHRNSQQAIADATKACELTNDRNPYCLESLAAAYAEAEDFEQAILWQEKALRMTIRLDRANREARLKLFREGKPFHEPPSEDQR